MIGEKIYEGDWYRGFGFIDDEQNGPWQVTVDWGHGDIEIFITDVKEFPLEHQYGDDGDFIVKITILNLENPCGPAILYYQIIVLNVDPTISGIATDIETEPPGECEGKVTWLTFQYKQSFPGQDKISTIIPRQGQLRF